METVFDLQGKRALVTGSTQGIGYAAARLLSARGASVVVHGGTSMEKCLKAAAGMHGEVRCALADLSRDGGAEELYRQAGDVDILVLNASIQVRKPWQEITPEEFDRQMTTNFKSALRLMQLFAPAMREKGWGRIVTVGSVQQTKPHKDMAVYAASKCALMSLVENVAKQLAPFGVTVNNVNPGVFATPRNAEALADPVYHDKVMAGIPMGRAGEPEECAFPILLLASEEGSYITGANLDVDGGMRL